MLSMLDRDRTVAGPGFHRWLIPPAALAVHLSIGQVYAFSVFKEPLVEHFDTKLTPISIIFSIAAFDDATVGQYGPVWSTAIPILLDELEGAGVPRTNVRLICANALHRKNTHGGAREADRGRPRRASSATACTATTPRTTTTSSTSGHRRTAITSS